jgi:chromosome segregation ATPase
VSAICLGLAGKIQSLARADKISQFIKRGQTKAYVEIELYNSRAHKKNFIIRRTMSALNNKSKFSINNRALTQSRVKKFVENKLNIKVDNLCQFLAQDRVSQFAQLSATELLLQTEKAMSDSSLYHMHEQLIEFGDDIQDAEQNINELIANKAQAENELQTLQKQQSNFKRKQKLEHESIVYNALFAWKDYYLKQNELAQLKRNMQKVELFLRNNKQSILAPIKKLEQQSMKKERQLQKKLHTIQGEIVGVEKNITKLRTNLKRNVFVLFLLYIHYFFLPFGLLFFCSRFLLIFPIG